MMDNLIALLNKRLNDNPSLVDDGWMGGVYNGIAVSQEAVKEIPTPEQHEDWQTFGPFRWGYEFAMKAVYEALGITEK